MMRPNILAARYAFFALRGRPMRFALIVSGMACCIVLMLFLSGVYRGLAIGSVEYVRANRADLWVLQTDALNLLRSTSILSSSHGVALEQQEGVRSVSGVLLYLATLRTRFEAATVFLVGYDYRTGSGAPPSLLRGRGLQSDREIVVDNVFARVHRIAVGDTVQILETPLRVVGLSAGTNAFAVQYAFVSLACARELSGFPGLTTAFLVKVDTHADVSAVSASLMREIPGIQVYDQETFLGNNVREMESGLLPIFYSVAAIVIVVLTALLSLLLTINILEQRKDIALVKVLGAQNAFVRAFVICQGAWIAVLGLTTGMLAFFPFTMALEYLSPEITVMSSFTQHIVVGGVVVAAALGSSWFALRRQRSIHAAEAFFS